MRRFVEEADRGQWTLLPECLDDFIDESNPVRVIDVFVDALDLAEMSFEGVEPAATGRPSYHPSVLLKLYIYGYLNRVQSSRRLEREAGRNVEVMWLLGRLAPDRSRQPFDGDEQARFRRRRLQRAGRRGYRAQLGSDCRIAIRTKKTARCYGVTGPQPVKIVRSNRNARPGQSGGLRDGSMSICSRLCSSALIQTHKPCAGVARQSSIRSAR
jgi:transposase